MKAELAIHQLKSGKKADGGGGAAAMTKVPRRSLDRVRSNFAANEAISAKPDRSAGGI